MTQSGEVNPEGAPTQSDLMAKPTKKIDDAPSVQIKPGRQEKTTISAEHTTKTTKTTSTTTSPSASASSSSSKVSTENSEPRTIRCTNDGTTDDDVESIPPTFFKKLPLALRPEEFYKHGEFVVSSSKSWWRCVCHDGHHICCF